MITKPHVAIQLWIALTVGAVLFWSCSDDNHSGSSGPDMPSPELPPKIIDADGTVDCDREIGDPGRSLFILPYLVGRSFRLHQGYCRTGGTHEERFALDFAIGYKDTVLAARSGVVTTVVEQYSDLDTVYGHHNYVLLRHRDGSIGFYAHLSTNSVPWEVGDLVRQGELLALNGASGVNTFLPHLHFEVWYDDSPYDPSNSVPINFRNCEGTLNRNNGLIDHEIYRALSFAANDN